jgi:hypothetical protein
MWWLEVGGKVEFRNPSAGKCVYPRMEPTEGGGDARGIFPLLVVISRSLLPPACEVPAARGATQGSSGGPQLYCVSGGEAHSGQVYTAWQVEP